MGYVLPPFNPFDPAVSDAQLSAWLARRAAWRQRVGMLLVLLLAIAGVLAISLPAFAQPAAVKPASQPGASASPAPADDPRFVWGSWTYSLTVVNFDTPDQHLVLGASAEAKLRVAYGIRLFGSAEASALQDGAAVTQPDITDPQTFNTLELYGGAYREVRPGVSVVALYGLALDVEGGSLAPVQRYPQSYGFGLRVGSLGGAWCYGLVGAHEASGTGPRLLGRCRVPIEGRSAAIADGALGGHGSYARFGIAVRLR